MAVSLVQMHVLIFLMCRVFNLNSVANNIQSSDPRGSNDPRGSMGFDGENKEKEESGRCGAHKKPTHAKEAKIEIANDLRGSESAIKESLGDAAEDSCDLHGSRILKGSPLVTYTGRWLIFLKKSIMFVRMLSPTTFFE